MALSSKVNGKLPAFTNTFETDFFHIMAAVQASTNVYTTSNGRPITFATASQRVGANGPLLLQDFHLIDILAHFDRERIPERVVHAKGAGAFGEFEVTHDITDIVSCFLYLSGRSIANRIHPVLG